MSSVSALNPKPEANQSHLAFIDSLINSVTRGEGALKQTCYQVLHSNDKTSFVEQEQCRKAKKEIEFSIRQYPVAQSFVRQYKGNQPINTANQIRYLSESSKFIKDCKSERNIRAAKTMRYWGTREVGNWHYTNLEKMGANDYKEILSACKPGSWVYKTQAITTDALSNIAKEISSSNYVPTCNSVANSKKWTNNQQSLNINTLNTISNKSETLEILSSQLNSSNSTIDGIDSGLLNSKLKQIKQAASYCETSITVGAKALLEQERDKARATAAKKEAERQYQRAKEAQRKAAAAEAARQQQAAAAEAARQQRIKKANEGVILD